MTTGRRQSTLWAAGTRTQYTNIMLFAKHGVFGPHMGLANLAVVLCGSFVDSKRHKI